MIEQKSYYKVNGKIFNHKIDAILYANQDKSDITWHFNQDVFRKIDWTSEPECSLDDLYLQRAQQIRDQFDYVVILCSGGADSTNVLKSFIDNGIMPDEIIASAPLEGLRNYNFNDQYTNHCNTMSETKFAQLPLLNEISQKYPNIKITLHDYFKDILDYKSEEWLYQCEDWVHPSSLARYKFERHKHLKDLAESGKKVGFVYGIDKPILVVSKDYRSLTINFADLTVNVQRPPFNQKYPNVQNILFYWTADLPELMVKQAHVLGKWIFEYENRSALRYLAIYERAMKTNYVDNRLRHSKYERAIVPCIYPKTHRKIFQAEKPTSSFLGEHDYWFYKLHKDTITYQMMFTDSLNFLNKLDKKYLNAQNSGLITLFNTYDLGPLTRFHKNKDELRSLINLENFFGPKLSESKIPENFLDLYFEI